MGLIMGALAYVTYSLTSGRDSVCAEMGVSALYGNEVEEVAGCSTCSSLFLLSSSQSEKQNKQNTKGKEHNKEQKNKDGLTTECVCVCIHIFILNTHTHSVVNPSLHLHVTFKSLTCGPLHFTCHCDISILF